jgi:hypothetical protein
MEHLSKIKHKRIQIQISNYLFQIRQLHMVLFKLEMIQANNKLFYTEKKIIQLNLTLLNYLRYYML